MLMKDVDRQILSSTTVNKIVRLSRGNTKQLEKLRFFLQNSFKASCFGGLNEYIFSSRCTLQSFLTRKLDFFGIDSIICPDFSSYYSNSFE